MNKKTVKTYTKDVFIIIVVFIAIIPLFYGYNLQNIVILTFNFNLFAVLALGLVILFLLGRLIFSTLLDEKSILQMENHDLVDSFIKKNQKWVKWFIFPLTMLMEELIFRFYAISIIINPIKLNPFLAVIISSSIFAAYHIHFWIRFKNFRIFISFFILSFFLGLLNGYAFIYFGLLVCFIIHYGMAFELYFYLYRKFYVKKQKR